jgi:hypothetical protein
MSDQPNAKRVAQTYRLVDYCVHLQSLFDELAAIVEHCKDIRPGTLLSDGLGELRSAIGKLRQMATDAEEVARCGNHAELLRQFSSLRDELCDIYTEAQRCEFLSVSLEAPELLREATWKIGEYVELLRLSLDVVCTQWRAEDDGHAN